MPLYLLKGAVTNSKHEIQFILANWISKHCPILHVVSLCKQGSMLKQSFKEILKERREKGKSDAGEKKGGNQEERRKIFFALHTVLGTFRDLLIYRNPMWNKYNYTHFTDEETEWSLEKSNFPFKYSYHSTVKIDKNIQDIHSKYADDIDIGNAIWRKQIDQRFKLVLSG